MLISLFPPWLLKLYKMLISPIAGGQVASVMVGECFVKIQSSVPIYFINKTNLMQS